MKVLVAYKKTVYEIYKNSKDQNIINLLEHNKEKILETHRMQMETKNKLIYTDGPHVVYDLGVEQTLQIKLGAPLNIGGNLDFKRK